MKYIMMVCMMAVGAQGWAAEQVENFTAKLFNSKGTVEYLKAGTSSWVKIQDPYRLEAGDQLRTGPDSKAELYIKYGSKVRLGADTAFTITTVAPEGNVVEVLRGKMHAWIRKFAGRSFSVRTPSAVCAVRGTVFGVEVSEAGQTTWDLFSGVIQISDNRNRTVDMVANQRVQVTQAEGAAAPVALPADVKAPSEPSRIKEEKVEMKAEEAVTEQKEKEAEAKTGTAEAKTEAAEAVVAEPQTTVIPTQTVTQSCEISASSPDCL